MFPGWIDIGYIAAADIVVVEVVIVVDALVVAADVICCALFVANSCLCSHTLTSGCGAGRRAENWCMPGVVGFLIVIS